MPATPEPVNPSGRRPRRVPAERAGRSSGPPHAWIGRGSKRSPAERVAGDRFSRGASGGRHLQAQGLGHRSAETRPSAPRDLVPETGTKSRRFGLQGPEVGPGQAGGPAGTGGAALRQAAAGTAHPGLPWPRPAARGRPSRARRGGFLVAGERPGPPPATRPRAAVPTGSAAARPPLRAWHRPSASGSTRGEDPGGCPPRA